LRPILLIEDYFLGQQYRNFGALITEYRGRTNIIFPNTFSKTRRGRVISRFTRQEVVDGDDTAGTMTGEKPGHPARSKPVPDGHGWAGTIMFTLGMGQGQYEDRI
jgi:hypothetical protein